MELLEFERCALKILVSIDPVKPDPYLYVVIPGPGVEGRDTEPQCVPCLGKLSGSRENQHPELQFQAKAPPIKSPLLPQDLALHSLPIILDVSG